MRRSSIVTALALTSLVSAFAAAPAGAETSIAVSPAVLDLSGVTGASGAVEIDIANAGDRAFDAVSEVVPLETADGLPSAVTWSSAAPERLTLEPGTSGSLRLELEIPDDAEPGGHYAAVSISTVVRPAADDPPAGVSGRILVPVLIAVSSDDPDDPRPVAEPALDRAALFLEPDGSLLARAQISNGGNVHVQLDGEVAIRRADDADDAGDADDASDDPIVSIDMPDGRVLPARSRLYPAADPLTLEPDRSFDVTFTFAVPAHGRHVPEPIIDTTTAVTNSPRIELGPLAACRTETGTLEASLPVTNDGTLGVTLDPQVWVEVPDGGRIAVAQPMRTPLAWPAAGLDIAATIDQPLGAGAYTLVAELAFGPDQTLRSELPFSVEDDGGDLPPCEPEAEPPLE